MLHIIIPRTHFQSALNVEFIAIASTLHAQKAIFGFVDILCNASQPAGCIAFSLCHPSRLLLLTPRVRSVSNHA
jgi:hypothetical protein